MPPELKPVTVIGPPLPRTRPITAPGFEVAVQFVSTAPFEAPATNDTEALLAEVAVAVPMLGAEGAAAEVETEGDEVEEGDEPTALLHVTLNV